MAINITVSLDDIAEKLEEANEFSDVYLNIATGEFAVVFEENIVDGNEELADEIEESKDYIRLPNQYDIHEYRIMEGFAEIVSDDNKRYKLFKALQGKRAYRRFKDELIYSGLEEAYYAFRTMTFYKMAREWCDDNGIPYVESEDK